MMYSGYVMQRKKIIIVICSMILIPDNLNQENQWILSIGCFEKKEKKISPHSHKCEFESHSWQGVLDSILFYKVCQ